MDLEQRIDNYRADIDKSNELFGLPKKRTEQRFYVYWCKKKIERKHLSSMSNSTNS